MAKLVQRGADINACTERGDTPLRQAIRTRNVNMAQEFWAIEFLLKLGASATKSCEGQPSPLELAMSANKRELVELFRKHHPKKLAVVTFDGPVLKPAWSWEAENPASLSEAIAAVGLKDTADPTRITIFRHDPKIGVPIGQRHDLVAIRGRSAPDVPLKHGDKITIPVRQD